MELIISKGLKVLIDDEDYELVKNYLWYGNKNPKKYYAVGYLLPAKYPLKLVQMHRLIMKPFLKDKLIVDHINGDTLDNRKINLRVCTTKENTHNRTSRIGSLSKYLGVTKVENKFRAATFANGKYKIIGVFDNEEHAAKAYDDYALKAYGEFANLNFKITK